MGMAQSFGWRLDSQTGVRNTGDPYGTSVTPNQNDIDNATWTEVIADSLVTTDVFGVLVCFNGNAVSTAARDTLVDIGVDTAGGTAYTVRIPTLIASHANLFLLGGIWYFFPLWFPAGSAVAARASVNNATVGSLAVWLQLLGKPRNPKDVRVGQKVDALGVTKASSSGTAFTEGTASMGTAVSLGTIPADWMFTTFGVGVNNGTVQANSAQADLLYGPSSDRRVLIEHLHYTRDAGERWAFNAAARQAEGWKDLPSGTELWIRGQSGSAAQTGVSGAAYGVRPY